MKPITPVKRLRVELGLLRAEFAERFHIPIGTLRDWEQRRSEPDQATQAYLKIIAADAQLINLSSHRLRGWGQMRHASSP